MRKPTPNLTNIDPIVCTATKPPDTGDSNNNQEDKIAGEDVPSHIMDNNNADNREEAYRQEPP